MGTALSALLGATVDGRSTTAEATECTRSPTASNTSQDSDSDSPSERSVVAAPPKAPTHLPLTEARYAYERAARRALNRENAAYDAAESQLHGITRDIDRERLQFFHPKREQQLRSRDIIYAINASMRQRERRRFDEYALATQMSAEQATAMRLTEVTQSGGGEMYAEEDASTDVTEEDNDGLRRHLASMVAQLCSQFTRTMDEVRPPTQADLEALEKAQAEAALNAMVEEALRLAMEAALDAEFDAALQEAARDVRPVHVLAANGIKEPGLPPSEVYAVAITCAQREHDRAIKAHRTTIQDRMAHDREVALEAFYAISRKGAKADQQQPVASPNVTERKPSPLPKQAMTARSKYWERLRQAHVARQMDPQELKRLAPYNCQLQGLSLSSVSA